MDFTLSRNTFRVVCVPNIPDFWMVLKSIRIEGQIMLAWILLTFKHIVGQNRENVKVDTGVQSVNKLI